MQFSMQILHRSWTEPTGWALIIAALGLAVWTLGEKSRPRLRPARARPSRRTDTRHVRRIDADSEWQRLVDIVEHGFTRAEQLVAAQARAVEEIEAADAAMSRLRAECTAAFMPSGAARLLQGRDEFEPRSASAPETQPLAA